MLLAFEGLKGPVELVGCDGLAEDIARVTGDWPFREIADSTEEPVITIELAGVKYFRDSPWLKKAAVFRDPVNAVCDFLVDLVKAYIADQPGMLCLHCAAVEFGDGLVVFANTYNTGKTLLVVELAAAGMRVFADDVMPLRAADNHGIGLCLMPRLRRPLPDDASQRFNAFLGPRRGATSKRFLYVNLRPGEIAPFGVSAPIRGVVVLDRNDERKPGMKPLRESDTLRALVPRNFARDEPALEIFDRLHNVVGAAKRYRLTYGTSEQAVTLLVDAFGGRP